VAPFRMDAGGSGLDTVVHEPGERPFALRLAPGRSGGVEVEAAVHGSARARASAAAAARRILGLDLDLGPFHALCGADPETEWIARGGMGRLLRSPSLYEDLVKLVLTTNCSWALTLIMARALVRAHGAETPGGERAFPAPEVLAAAPETALRETCRLGYRAPSVRELSRRVAEGEFDLGSWERRVVEGAEPAEDLDAEIRTLPGVGPYVSQNLFKFLGRPRGLALDSALRARYAQLYHGGRAVTDRTIARRYARFGAWAGLALWFALSREWIDDELTGPEVSSTIARP
jgi:3-methyladenine DNA glycosylase/8-oxoguanine DNA glycosylase